MDITNFYISLLEQFRTVKFAEIEFRRQMSDDPDLQRAYELWCLENELEPKNALREFGHNYMIEREERWQSLNDFNEM